MERFHCIVEKCLNQHHVASSSYVKFFMFPSNVFERDQWINELASGTGIEKEVVQDYLRRCNLICSLHFQKEHFFVNQTGYFKLQDYIIPNHNLTGGNIIMQIIRSQPRIRNPSNIMAVGATREILYKNVVGDESLNTLLSLAKTRQLNVLKGIRNFSLDKGKSGSPGVEKGKNRLSANETGCFRCRICLHSLKRNRLIPFSTKLVTYKSKTVQETLVEIVPSISDRVKPSDFACDVCLRHLLITVHFFKLILDIEDITERFLKDDPTIFNGSFEKTYAEEHDGLNNALQAETVDHTKNKVEGRRENVAVKQEIIDDFSSLEDDSVESGTEIICPTIKQELIDDVSSLEESDTKQEFLNDSIVLKSPVCNTNRNYTGAAITTSSGDAKERRNDVPLKPVSYQLENLVDSQSCKDLETVCVTNQQNSQQSLSGKNNDDDNNHLTTSPLSVDSVDFTLDVEEEHPSCNLIEMEEMSLLCDGIEEGSHNISASTLSKSESGVKHEKEQAKEFTGIPKTNSSNLEKLEQTLLQELNGLNNFSVQKNHVVLARSVENPYDIIEGFSDSAAKVVLADFNVGMQKRIIFIGETICTRCRQPAPHCNCLDIAEGMCDRCGRFYKTRANLQHHFYECRQNRYLPKPCPRCNTFFRTEALYKRHLEKTADAPVCNYLKCKLCNVKFSRRDFVKHIIEHPNKVCAKCGKSVLTLGQCGCDKKAEQTRKKLQCNICGGMYHHLKIHLRSHYAKRVRCEVCKLLLRNRKTLQFHMRSRHRERIHSCHICDKKFGCHLALRLHIKRLHLEAPVMNCKICNINFNTRNDLRLHLKKKHPQPTRKKPMMCTFCKKVLPYQTSMRMHMLCHFPKRYKCKYCSFVSILATMNKHEALHRDPEYKFSCKICYALKKTEDDLRNHMKKFHTRKPSVMYQCYHCNEKFQRKVLLRLHIYGHHTDGTELNKICSEYYTNVEEPSTFQNTKGPPLPSKEGV